MQNAYWKKAISLLLCLCMVVPLLSGMGRVASAEGETDPVEKLLEEGAEWLDDFMKNHPGASLSGSDDGKIGDDDAKVNPGWFKVAVRNANDEGRVEDLTLLGEGNTVGSFFTAFESGGSLSHMTLTSPIAGYTDDEETWPVSGGMEWSEEGFLKDSAGFPVISIPAANDGYSVQYAVKAVYLGDSRLYNVGIVTDEDGDKRLWIALDKMGSTAVVLPDTAVSPRIELYYAPEEYPVTYDITVDDKKLEDMTSEEISKVWGEDITTAEQALTAVIGLNPTTSTKSQTANMQITIPAGTYGHVYFDNDTAESYPPSKLSDYGNFRLGNEVEYTYKTNGESGDAKFEWCEVTASKTSPSRFSYSEPYSYGEAGKADGEVKVRVVIETRDDYQYSLKYFVSFATHTKAHEDYSTPGWERDRKGDRYGDLTYDEDTDTYNWTWTFRVGRSTSDDQNGLLRLGINGESVEIPRKANKYTTGSKRDTVKTSEDYYRETTLSDGSVVRVTMTERFLNGGLTGGSAVGCSYYTVTVTNAKRDVVITDFVADEAYMYGRVIVESDDGVHMQIGHGSSGTSWRDYTAGGICRYESDGTGHDFYFVGNQIRVSLNPGYVWPGTKQDGTLPDTVSGNYAVAGWNTNVWAEDPGEWTGDIPEKPTQAKPSRRTNSNAELYDAWEAYEAYEAHLAYLAYLAKWPMALDLVKNSATDSKNNNAAWYYITNFTMDNLPKINNTDGRQSIIHVNAIPSTYQIQYLPGITVNNGRVTVTGGNMKYLTDDKYKDFKYFVLGDDSMPFAGTDALDPALYTMQKGSNQVSISLTEPLDDSAAAVSFKYWVLTDMEGYPVDKNGNRVSTTDESTWVKYYPGEIVDMTTIDAYTKKEGAADFEGGTVQRYTVFLTAFWSAPETPFSNFVTVNTVADAEGKYAGQFAGEAYNKTTGDPIFDGDTETSDGDKINVAIPVVGFLDMTEVKKNNTETDKGITVTVSKADILNFMREQGGDYLWYALDEDPTHVKDGKKYYNHNYIWEDVGDKEELAVWFLYTLGSLKLKNTIEGQKDAIEFKITFKLPEDSSLTAGNEEEFFGKDSFSVKAKIGDEERTIALTKKDGAYVGYFKLENEELIEFPKLPAGTWYLLELAEDERSGGDNHNCGYILKDGDKGDVYDFIASTVWNDRESAKDGDMTIDKVVADRVVRYGNKDNGIVAYDAHEIDLTVLGTYKVDLQQETVHPDKDPDTDDEAVNTDDVQNYVQNFSYLTYTVSAKNLTDFTQTLNVILAVNSEDISQRVDQNGKLDGVRILNLEEIDGCTEFTIKPYTPSETQPDPQPETPSETYASMRRAYALNSDGDSTDSTDIDEVYLITLSNGTEIIYDCSGEVHTLTWPSEEVEAGGTTTKHDVKTSVPAVRGLTNYTGTAAVVEAESSEHAVMDGEPATSNDVEAKVYSYWLRILAYVVNENYVFAEGEEVPTFKFKVTLDDSDPDNFLNDTIHYMLFNSAEDFGTSKAVDGSPFEAKLIPTETEDEYYFEFTLKHGQRIVIYDLDKDFTYKVECLNLDELDYLQSKLTTNTTGSVGSNGAASISDGIDMVAFHFYPTEALTVNSTIKDGVENTGKTFDYTVKLTLPAGVDWDEENPAPSLKIGETEYALEKQDNYTDEDGQTHAVYTVTATLGDGMYFKLPDLPEDTAYEIAANIENGYVFSATMASADGTDGAKVDTPNNTIKGVVDNDGNAYNVTVTKNAQLTITANISSPVSGDLAKPYRFTVTLKDAAGKPISGTFYIGGTPVTFNAQGRATVSVPVTAAGDGTVTGSVTITGIPANTSYTVTPVAADYAYMDVDVEGSTAAVLGAGAEVTVSHTFTRKIGSLTIKKEVSDYNQETDGDSFKFTVTLTDNYGNLFSGTFYIGETSVTFENGVAEVTVSVDGTGKGSITIPGMPAGLSYSIEENLENPDLYYPDWDGTNDGIVDADDDGGTTATCINDKTVTVTVKWGNLTFDLTNINWNPETHDYVGDTFDPQGENIITVGNLGGQNEHVTIRYEQAEGYTGIQGLLSLTDDGTGEEPDPETPGTDDPIGEGDEELQAYAAGVDAADMIEFDLLSGEEKVTVVKLEGSVGVYDLFEAGQKGFCAGRCIVTFGEIPGTPEGEIETP